MTKKLKNISELPKWFQLKKYANAKNLDAAGWYQQLRIRGVTLMYFDLEDTEIRTKIINAEEFKEGIEILRNKPIININEEEYQKFSEFFYFDDIDIALKATSPNYLLGISFMTLEEFNTLRKGIDPDRLEYTEKWTAQFAERAWEALKPPYKYKKWIRQPIQDSIKQKIGVDPIMVDLQFPDKILIENFKRYLVTRRTETNTEYLSKPNRQQNFAEWIRQGVLPYLDLIIWELESNIRIPLRLIADAIYPQGEGGEENVRKTTIPLANSLLQPGQLRQLAAQAAIELTEKSKA